MAERGRPGGSRELVFCHSCENEWYQNEHGLQCPQCESEIVEIVEENNDPRHGHLEEFLPHTPPSPPQHPLHDHNPWDHDHHHGVEDPGDPDEGDINHVEWHRGGVHFSSMSYRSPTIHMGGPGGAGPANNNMFSMVSQIMGTLAGPPMPGNPSGSDSPRQRGSPGPNAGSPGGGFRIGLTSPLQEGPPQRGHTRTYTATVGLQPRPGGNGPQTQTFPFEELQGQAVHLIILDAHPPATAANPLRRMLSAILGPNGPAGAAGFPALFASLLDPTNARHGDAVYSQEALDRVITQLMEQHRGSTAPGPASAAAIAALPKVPIEKSMLGDNGKAECSVCMDSVSVGDEVTMLPCKHWFHGECVGAWLSEHDTCPHCRQSITPKEGNREEPRSPDQAPLHSPSWPFPGGGPEGASPQEQRRGSQSRHGSLSGLGSVASGERSERRRSETSGSQGRRGSSRRESNENGGNGNGGLTGWFSRRMGGGNGNVH